MTDFSSFAPSRSSATCRTPFVRFFRLGVVGLLVGTLALAGLTGCRKKTPDEQLQEINQLFRQQEIVKAVLKAKDLIRNFPDDPSAYDARGLLAYYYFQTGDPERSHEYLKQIYTGLGAEDVHGYQALLQDAQIYQMQEDYKTALATVDWGLKTLPHDAPSTPNLLLSKAALLVGSDSTTQGIQLFRTLMLHASQPQVRGIARERLAQYYRQEKQYQKEIGVYNEYEQSFNEPALKPQFDIVRGMALKNLGKTKEGEALFDEGIAAMKKNAEEELEQNKAANDWMAVAQYYLAADKVEEGAKVLQSIREKYPKIPAATDAGVTLGNLRLQQKRYDDAIDIYEQVREDNPLGPVAGQLAQLIQHAQQLKMQAESTTPTLKAEAKSASMSDVEGSESSEEAAPAASPEPMEK